jgi:ABC-type thiamine transport system ATPase subunit
MGIAHRQVMPVDLAADRMGIQYIHNCLPPYLSGDERQALARGKQVKVQLPFHVTQCVRACAL